MIIIHTMRGSWMHDNTVSQNGFSHTRFIETAHETINVIDIMIGLKVHSVMNATVDKDHPVVYKKAPFYKI